MGAGPNPTVAAMGGGVGATNGVGVGPGIGCERRQALNKINASTTKTKKMRPDLTK